MIYKVFLNEGAMRAVGAHIEIVADGVEIEASGILSLLRNEAGLQATQAKFNHTAWSYYTVHEEPKPIEVASPIIIDVEARSRLDEMDRASESLTNALAKLRSTPII